MLLMGLTGKANCHVVNGPDGLQKLILFDAKHTWVKKERRKKGKRQETKQMLMARGKAGNSTRPTVKRHVQLLSHARTKRVGKCNRFLFSLASKKVLPVQI